MDALRKILELDAKLLVCSISIPRSYAVEVACKMRDADQDQNITLQLRIPQGLVDQVDQHRQSLKLTPTRSQMIRYLLERGLEFEAKEPSLSRGG